PLRRRLGLVVGQTGALVGFDEGIAFSAEVGGEEIEADDGDIEDAAGLLGDPPESGSHLIGDIADGSARVKVGRFSQGKGFSGGGDFVPIPSGLPDHPPRFIVDRNPGFPAGLLPELPVRLFDLLADGVAAVTGDADGGPFNGGHKGMVDDDDAKIPPFHVLLQNHLVSVSGGESAGPLHLLRCGDVYGDAFSLLTPEGFDEDRKSTRLNSSHVKISYAVFCLKKKTKYIRRSRLSR